MIMHLLFLRKKEVAFSTFFPFNTKHELSIQEWVLKGILSIARKKQKGWSVEDSNDNMWKFNTREDGLECSPN
jgi:hypothetical protein